MVELKSANNSCYLSCMITHLGNSKILRSCYGHKKNNYHWFSMYCVPGTVLGTSVYFSSNFSLYLRCKQHNFHFADEESEVQRSNQQAQGHTAHIWQNWVWNQFWLSKVRTLPFVLGCLFTLHISAATFAPVFAFCNISSCRMWTCPLFKRKSLARGNRWKVEFKVNGQFKVNCHSSDITSLCILNVIFFLRHVICKYFLVLWILSIHHFNRVLNLNKSF